MLKLILRLTKCPNSDSKPLIYEHFSDSSVLQKLIPLLFVEDKVIRHDVIQIFLTITSPSSSFTEVSMTHIGTLKSGLLEKYVSIMFKFLRAGEEDWPEIWCCVVRLLGLELHKGGPVYVNTLLGVLEEAFKSNTNVGRIYAFQCWQVNYILYI